MCINNSLSGGSADTLRPLGSRSVALNGFAFIAQATPEELANTADSFKAMAFNQLLRKFHQFDRFAWLSLGHEAHQQPLDAFRRER